MWMKKIYSVFLNCTFIFNCFTFLFLIYTLEAMTEMLKCEERQRSYETEKENIVAKLQNE